MGGNSSNLIPQPTGFDYMCVALIRPNKIRLLYANNAEISAVRGSVSQFWSVGIKDESLIFGNAYEFRLNGKPFYFPISAEDTVAIRRLACNMLYSLHNLGSRLLISSDLTRRSDLSTWFFHRENIQPLQIDMACIGVSNDDKLQFVNFPTSTNELIKNTVATFWPQQIQTVKFIAGTMEIKLRGHPWRSTDAAENIQAKTLIKALINELCLKHWILYGSGNLRGTSDTIFFSYDQAVLSDGLRPSNFVISLCRNDRIRCIDAPEDAVQCIKEVVSHLWTRGIKETKSIFNAIELKLDGNPWWSRGSEAVYSCFMMCKVFERLMTIGWRVQLGLDLSRKLNDKSAFIFQPCQPCSLPIFCINLNKNDRICFINAPQNVTEMLRAEIARNYGLGIAHEFQHETSFELKLKGSPWEFQYNGHDGAHARVLLCHLIKACAQMGWFLMLSADVSSQRLHRNDGSQFSMDVHSLWFVWYGQSHAQQQLQSTSNLNYISATGQFDPVFPSAPPSYDEVMAESY